MFTRIRPAGFLYRSLLGSAELTQLDIDHANAVDGVGGGAYDGPLDLTNVRHLVLPDDSTGAYLGSGLTVRQGLFVSEGMTLQGDALDASAVTDSSFAAVHASGNVQIDGGLVVEADTSLDAVYLRGPLIPTGTAASIRCRPYNTADADDNYNISLGDIFFVPNLPTVNRTYNLVDTYAGENDICEFSACFNTDGQVADLFLSDGSGPFPLGNSGTSIIWLKARFNGTHWQVVGYSRR